MKFCFLCFVFSVLSIQNLAAQKTSPIAYWQFDGAAGSTTIESIQNTKDTIAGYFEFVKGVRGQALKFDGFTTRISLDSHAAPEVEGAVTFEAWLAPQAYPWNWSAIVERKNRYFFGLDATGHIGLRVYIDKQWRECVSATQIPFMQWSHVAATFDPEKGLAVYINGQSAGRLAMAGHLEGGGGMFQIGRNLEEIPAASSRKIPASFSFDGIIDDLKIYRGALSDSEIAETYQSTRPADPPALVWRKLPKIPDGQKHFGAYYTRLKFYPEWDRLWRIDDFPDLVVTFDEAPYKMVFWHGTTYNMNLVTENGRWIGDQSAEAPPGEYGCIEHMSDKQARYSHVRLLENTPARIVVHWRRDITIATFDSPSSVPENQKLSKSPFLSLRRFAA